MMKPLPHKKYKIIYADPPWRYRNAGNIRATAEEHYRTLSLKDLSELPVNEIADDNSILFLWATFPKIQEALILIKAWGFIYKTVGFTWIKKNKCGSNFFGVGWYTKSNAEICLIGTKGKSPKISNSVSSIVESVREEHSKKPSIVRDKIIQFCGDLPRIELFARQKINGWDAWGNEVEKEGKTKMIYVDCETRSEIDLLKVGAYKYARHESTEILCLRYKIDNRKVELWIPGFTEKENQIPLDLQFAVANKLHLFESHNANFEINIWEAILVKQFGWPSVPLARWRCSAVKAAMYSLPRKLETVAKVLKLGAQKDMEGHRVMLQLTKPRNPSKNNPDKFFSDEIRFKKLYKYCKQDVETEYALSQKLKPLNEEEWYNWFLDQKINNFGIYVDVEGVKAAQKLTQKLERKAQKQIQKLTNGFISSPTEIAKIKMWCAKKGMLIESLTKEKLDDIIKDKKTPKAVKKIVRLRDQNNKSSTAKLKSILSRVNPDGRIRDNLLFYGAHTGRWTGTGVQVQSLPKGKLKHAQVIAAIKAIKQNDLETLKEFGKPLEVISYCLRGFFCAPPGRELICADYSSIEARLVLWLAGETTVVKQLSKGKDIYKDLAAIIYKRPVNKIDKVQRDNGKRGILGGGYGMGWKKQKETAKKYGAEISDELSKAIIKAYRETYSKVPLLWKAIEKAAVDCIFHKMKTKVKGIAAPIYFKKKRKFLLCKLPSGRVLTYYDPRLSYGKYDKLQLTYMGVDSKTKQWSKQYTWGGKLTENIIQALARDILASGMREIDLNPKYDLIFSLHDEPVAECDKGKGDKKEFVKLATTLPDWAKGCPIEIGKDDCWIGKRYRKG